MKLGELIRYTILLGVSGGILGLSIFLYAGTLPPPMHQKRVKVNPVLTTLIFIIGMTGLHVYGTPDLLKQWLNFLFPG